MQSSPSQTCGGTILRRRKSEAQDWKNLFAMGGGREEKLAVVSLSTPTISPSEAMNIGFELFALSQDDVLFQECGEMKILKPSFVLKPAF